MEKPLQSIADAAQPMETKTNVQERHELKIDPEVACMASNMMGMPQMEVTPRNLRAGNKSFR